MTDRPYPNVQQSKSRTDRWTARLPDNKRPLHLGTFDSAEAARCAVLRAQAERLEARAARYRAEADDLEGTSS